MSTIRPRSQIKIYDTDDDLVYTVTDALQVRTKSVVTDGIGTFSFLLPGKKATSYVYNDIGNNYRCEISLGWATLTSDDLVFNGKILRIVNTGELKGRFSRVFSGKDLGHVLERRLKTNRRYEDLDASTIVTVDIATELDIYSVANAGKIDTDTTEETVTIRTEPFLDYLRKVSDYWHDGATKVQKDFFVDSDDELMWKARPIRSATTNVTGTADSGNTTTTVDTERTEAADYWNGCFIKYTSGTNSGLRRLITDFDAATDTLTHLPFPAVVDGGDQYSITGVETLVHPTNILAYSLSYDIAPVKNRITVYGAASAYLPNDQDTFTEALSGTYYTKDWEWTAASGTLSIESGGIGVKEGTYRIYCLHNATPGTADFALTLPLNVNLRDINKLSFWYYANVPSATIQLYAPDDANYFEATLDALILDWKWFSQTLGDSNVYDADENPSGVWTKTGSANWWNITAVKFYGSNVGGPAYINVDKLYFSPWRWVATAPDPDDEPTTSQTVYDLREAEYTDENLLSNAECQKRANTLLYQLDDKVIALECACRGNINLRIGDRVPVTLPAENGISAIDFDIVSVEHMFDEKPAGWRTNVGLISGANQRAFSPRTPVESVQRSLNQLKAVTSELYSRVVR